MALQITTPNAAEPVTLAMVKARLRLTNTADDALITSQIPVARAFAEKVCRRSLALKSYALSMDRFPHFNHPIRIPVPPLVEVQSITFLDDTLTLQTWDPTEYYIAAAQSPALIVPAPGFIYPPPTPHIPGGVSVNFTAGYTVVLSDGGAPITDQHAAIAIEAICRLSVYLYQAPEAVLVDGMKPDPLGAISMLRSIKIYEF